MTLRAYPLLPPEVKSPLRIRSRCLGQFAKRTKQLTPRTAIFGEKPNSRGKVGLVIRQLRGCEVTRDECVSGNTAPGGGGRLVTRHVMTSWGWFLSEL